jgi:hypothetical protein
VPVGSAGSGVELAQRGGPAEGHGGAQLVGEARSARVDSIACPAVGENAQYLVAQERGRVLAAVVFGSAAWKCRARDGFIGCNAPARERNLSLITKNTRFLRLPWVPVPRLGSWILGRQLAACRRGAQHRNAPSIQTPADRCHAQTTSLCYVR